LGAQTQSTTATRDAGEFAPSRACSCRQRSGTQPARQRSPEIRQSQGCRACLPSHSSSHRRHQSRRCFGRGATARPARRESAASAGEASVSRTPTPAAADRPTQASRWLRGGHLLSARCRGARVGRDARAEMKARATLRTRGHAAARARAGEIRERLPGVLTDSHGKQLIDLLFDLRRWRYGTSHCVGLLQLSLTVT
jgi:hypothetical protein